LKARLSYSFNFIFFMRANQFFKKSIRKYICKCAQRPTDAAPSKAAAQDLSSMRREEEKNKSILLFVDEFAGGERINSRGREKHDGE